MARLTNMPRRNESHVSGRGCFQTTIAVLRRLRFLFPISPVLLHHLGDALARSHAHVAAWACGHNMTAGWSSTTTARAEPFQCRDGSVDTFTFSLKIT